MKQKLIDQLIHKAGARFGGDGINYDLFVPSKFAELIIEECIQLCQECIDDGCVEAQEPMGKIKQHFGVEECWCESCKPNTMTDMRMILCQICGNKRCPHATNHIYECTNSNEPGQIGSSWENYKVGVES